MKLHPVRRLDQRAAGLLLHPTSLPGGHGVGDLGPAAHAFAGLLRDGGQGWWQTLPVGPAGWAGTPYESPSSFAGNPLLVSLDFLADEGWLGRGTLEGAGAPPAGPFDPRRAEAFKEPLLRDAFGGFQRESGGSSVAFDEFRDRAGWLEDYCLFAALKRFHRGAPWWDWDEALRRREAGALAAARARLADDLAFLRFVQFAFDAQWRRLRERCRALGVALIGDVPIYVSGDSMEVWARQDLFFLGPDGRPAVVAGVPPDYFSATGQRWGNPIYRWGRMAEEGFGWYLRRLSVALERFDAVRLDHFIGFRRFWEVPAQEPDAVKGRWATGPGEAFFERVFQEFEGAQLIAEDLGVVSPDVREMRDRFLLPGMRVLQFAFGADPDAPAHRPENHTRRSVVYTGTHDNDTVMGWWTGRAGQGRTDSEAQVRGERDAARRAFGGDGAEPNWGMIRLAYESQADLAIVPVQDVLGLGAEARMNTPGTSEGNWRWRLGSLEALEAPMRRLKALAREAGRA